ncbi:Uncharacterised protein [Clostridioides difficile]|nr:Uncharacterised protein [Clostridioides difficile]
MLIHAPIIAILIIGFFNLLHIFLFDNLRHHANAPPTIPKIIPKAINFQNIDKSNTTLEESAKENFSNPKAFVTSLAVKEAINAGKSD